MKTCWNDDSESRPTFLELKEVLDGLISQEEGCNYLVLSNALLEEACDHAVSSTPLEEGCADHEVDNETTDVVESVSPGAQSIARSECGTTVESEEPPTKSTVHICCDSEQEQS